MCLSHRVYYTVTNPNPQDTGRPIFTLSCSSQRVSATVTSLDPQHTGLPIFTLPCSSHFCYKLQIVASPDPQHTGLPIFTSPCVFFLHGISQSHFWTQNVVAFLSSHYPVFFAQGVSYSQSHLLTHSILAFLSPHFRVSFTQGVSYSHILAFLSSHYRVSFTQGVSYNQSHLLTHNILARPSSLHITVCLSHWVKITVTSLDPQHTGLPIFTLPLSITNSIIKPQSKQISTHNILTFLYSQCRYLSHTA